MTVSTMESLHLLPVLLRASREFSESCHSRRKTVWAHSCGLQPWMRIIGIQLTKTQYGYVVLKQMYLLKGWLIYHSRHHSSLPPFQQGGYLAWTRPTCGPSVPIPNIRATFPTKFFCRLNRRCPILKLPSIRNAMSALQSGHTEEPFVRTREERGGSATFLNGCLGPYLYYPFSSLEFSLVVSLKQWQHLVWVKETVSLEGSPCQEKLLTSSVIF